MMSDLPILKAVKLLQITDTHCYAADDSRLEWSDLELYPNKSLIRVLDHLTQLSGDYDALIISGDLVQEETVATYQRLHGILNDFPLPVYILPGNHDVPELMRSELSAQSERIHYVTHTAFGRWHAVFVDTHLTGHPEGDISEEEFAELKRTLDELPLAEHAVIFMHHHPVPIGSPWMDHMGLKQTEPFWSLLADFPQVRSVVFGHIHSEFSTEYPVTAERNIRVLGTPATCVQAKHNDEEMQLDDTRPAWRELVLRPDGQVETAVSYLPN
uniref:3',5'-cyclic-nucleotide phosphodiesterase (EC) n=1 Tax=uncultured Thiotrichaceae bacterium TaxID=298394 RepID=A0A6S6UMS2_9GAMM|nr:MAG: 3',5'-cyclic-nucleotide phosphodiesterase (EC [uncultured Thiotrichaceae bacterium]